MTQDEERKITDVCICHRASNQTNNIVSNERVNGRLFTEVFNELRET